MTARGLRAAAGWWVTGALLVSAAGCSAGHRGTIDGSCFGGLTTVTSLDAGSGEQRWARVLRHPREDRPEVSDGAVLLRGCGVVVLSTQDGHRLYRQVSEDGLVGLAATSLVTRDEENNVTATTPGAGVVHDWGSTPPYELVTVAGDVVLLGLGDELSAYDVAGPARARWRTTIPALHDATVTAAGTALVLSTSDGSLYRVDRDSGAVAWRAVPGPPAIGYGKVLAVDPTTAVVLGGREGASEDGTMVVGIDLTDGGERWRTEVSESAEAGLTTAGGVVVVPTRRSDGEHGQVAGLVLTTGKVLWRADSDADEPVGAGDVIVLDEPTAAVALDARTGTEVWRVPTRQRPLLAAVPGSDQVVVLDSPPVAHGSDDCC